MLTRLAPRRAAPPTPDAEFVAYCIIDQPGGTPSWVRCGAGRANRDGSLEVRLDALPLNGELHLRPARPAAAHAPAEGPDDARPPSPAPPQPLHS